MGYTIDAVFAEFFLAIWSENKHQMLYVDLRRGQYNIVCHLGQCKYSRGYKKCAASGKFYLTLNERKTYFKTTFTFFKNRL